MQDSLALELIEILKNLQVKDGEDGKDGFCFPLNNMFSFVADEEGNVYYYINEEGETSKKLLGNFKGKDGIGINGLSAYEISKKSGFVGTETEWLESLKSKLNSSIKKWKNVISQRELSKYYYNNTDDEMTVSVSILSPVGTASGLEVFVDDIKICYTAADATSRRSCATFPLSVGSKYKINIAGGSITTWVEYSI